MSEYESQAVPAEAVPAGSEGPGEGLGIRSNDCHSEAMRLAVLFLKGNLSLFWRRESMLFPLRVL